MGELRHFRVKLWPRPFSLCLLFALVFSSSWLYPIQQYFFLVLAFFNPLYNIQYSDNGNNLLFCFFHFYFISLILNHLIMIAGTIGTNSCGNKHILLLINLHPVVGTKVHSFISSSQMVKIHVCVKVIIRNREC